MHSFFITAKFLLQSFQSGLIISYSSHRLSFSLRKNVIQNIQGIREGTIWGFGYEFVDENDAKVYTDLLIIGDNEVPFSTHGDSGSLIVTAEENKGIGLLWGGWQEKLRSGYAQENWTYGIALDRVLKALNIELVTE